MSEPRLSREALETVYERLAEALDKAGERNETVLLAKLVLLLAEEIGDAGPVLRALAAAQANLGGGEEP